jgi:hypothetical protein
MGSFHELKATAFPQAFVSKSKYGWEVEAALAKEKADKEADKHPKPITPSNPLVPPSRPVNYRILEDVLARSRRGRR